MPSTGRQTAKARKHREMHKMFDFDNLEDVMIEKENANPIERELANAIEESSVHGDTETNMYSRNEFRDFTYEKIRV